MTRLLLVATIAIVLLIAPPPPAYQCGSDAECSAAGIIVCPACPDYTEGEAS